MKFTIKCLFLAFIYIGFLFGQISGQLLSEEIQFHHLTDKDGLSQRTVRTILQDSEGYMWFGTHDGLNRYNGNEMIVYRRNKNNPNSLSYNEVAEVYEDSNQNLWIATLGAGLNLYNRDKDNFTRYDYEDVPGDPELWMNENTTYSITEDPQGNIWLGTENGLVILNTETETFSYRQSEPDKPGGLSHHAVSALFTDSHGNIWVGTHSGLNILKKGENKFTRFLHDPNDPQSLSNDHIQEIYEDSNGEIWIGTQRGGLNHFNRETGHFTSYMHDEADTNSISDNSVIAILEDSQGVLWIGTENEGLNAFDRESKRFSHHKRNDGNPMSLNNNAIYSIYEDKNNMLWIGTYNGGLNRTDRTTPKFEHFSHNPFKSNSLSTNSVLSFLEDRNGNIWIGTDGGGLNLFDKEKKEFEVYRNDPDNKHSIPGDVIFDLAEDENGYIWIGTYRNSLSRFDPQNNTFRHYKYNPNSSNSLNHIDIFTLFIDSENPEELWVGTNGGGINLLNTETEEFTHYVEDPDNSDSINNNYIRYFHKDSRGTFRIGNYGGALVTFDRESEVFEMHDISDEYFHSNVVQMIYEDSRERLWLSTWGGGLILLDRSTGELTTYTEQDGLPNNNLHGILEDSKGNLWISSNRGLTEFNPETETFNNFGIEDGLQSWEFNARAVMKDSEGYMYFGGVNGFNRFHPDSIKIDEYTAPVILSDFRIFNESAVIDDEDSPLDKHISRTDELVLSYQESVITFEYVTLNFDINKNDQYAYKLEGFDSDWNEVGGLQSATYTNLKPGNYTFRVRAANSNGIWSDKVASIDLIITPPFWQTAWFYFLSFVVITGIIGGGVRWRMRSITEQNKRLEKEVAKQTSELSDKNAELKQVLEDLKDTRNELVEKAHKAGMADLATSVMHNVGNILNSVNVSTSLMGDIIKNSQLKNLHKANSLLKENLDSIEDFILNNPKGKKLLKYYVKLDKPISDEYEKLEKQNNRLAEKIDLIIDVVAAQQNYSTAGRIREYYSLERIVDDTVTIQANSFDRHKVQIEKDFSEAEKVLVEKTKLVHILVNLFKNAVESIDQQNSTNRQITIHIYQESQQVFLSVTDTGTGFDSNQQSKIFTHGFTTKKTGHGYGLHSCANYMKEMGGNIKVKSDGPGKGATFILIFPEKLLESSSNSTDKKPDHKIEKITENIAD